MIDLAEERLAAAVSLIGHTGAKDLEFGYLHDDAPIQEAAWWAKAQYQGARIQVENKTSPIEALEALAIEVLTGGLCKWCEGLIALTVDGALAFPGSVMADGSHMPKDPEEIAKLGQCLWRRNGSRWEPGCIHGQSTAPKAPAGRSAQRRLYRRFEATREHGGTASPS